MEISKKRSEKYEKWQAIIVAHEASGISRAEFCRQNEISKSNFSYYINKLKAKDGNKTENRPKEAFSSIKIKQTESMPFDIKILLPNGFQCMVPSTVDSFQIKKLIEVLLSC